MLFLEMCDRDRRVPSSILALRGTEKFPGRVAETLLTVVTILETIHTLIDRCVYWHSNI